MAFFCGCACVRKKFLSRRSHRPWTSSVSLKVFFLNQFQGSPLCLCNSGWHRDAIRYLSGQWFYGEEFTVRLLALILHYQQLVKSYAMLLCCCQNNPHHKTTFSTSSNSSQLNCTLLTLTTTTLLCYKIIYLCAMPPKKEFRLLHQKQKTPVRSSR